MVSVMSASRNHLRYQSRSLMYIRGLIPRNFAELAEAVPFAQRLEEGKDQEYIQSRTVPNPGHLMGEWQMHKKTSHTEAPRGQPFPSW